MGATSIGAGINPVRYRPGSKLFDNKSLLCDKWLRFKDCNRTNCEWDHRDPRPGEILPLCPKIAASLGNYDCPPECPLRHDYDPLLLKPTKMRTGNPSPNPVEQKPKPNEGKAKEVRKTRVKRIDIQRKESRETVVADSLTEPQSNLETSSYSLETATRTDMEAGLQGTRPVVRIPKTPVDGSWDSSSSATESAVCSQSASTAPLPSESGDPLLQTTSREQLIVESTVQQKTHPVMSIDQLFEKYFKAPSSQDLLSRFSTSAAVLNTQNTERICTAVVPLDCQPAPHVSGSSIQKRTVTSTVTADEVEGTMSTSGPVVAPRSRQLAGDPCTTPVPNLQPAQPANKGKSDTIAPPGQQKGTPPATGQTAHQSFSPPPIILSPVPRRNSSVAKIISTNTPHQTEKASNSALEVLQQQVRQLEAPLPLCEQKSGRATGQKKPAQHKDNAGPASKVDRPMSEVAELGARVPEQRSSPFQAQFMEIKRQTLAIRDAIMAPLRAEAGCVESKDESLSEIKRSHESPACVPRIALPALENCMHKSVAPEVQQEIPSNGETVKPAAAMLPRPSCPTPTSAKPIMQGAIQPISKDSTIPSTKIAAGATPKINTSGYVEHTHICYNCWDVKAKHFLELCPEPSMPHLDREILRQHKRIWNKRWVVQMINRGYIDSLYVPPEYLDSLKGQISDEAWESLSDNTAADRVRILKRVQSPVRPTVSETPVPAMPCASDSQDMIPISSPQHDGLSGLEVLGVPARDLILPTSTSRHNFSDSAIKNPRTSTKPVSNPGITVPEARPQSELNVHNAASCPSDNFILAPDMPKKQMCWNCWETDQHSGRSCPKQQVRLSERERRRQKAGHWCPNWARNLINHRLLSELKIPQEQWPVVRAMLEAENYPVCFLRLNKEGFVEELNNVKAAVYQPQKTDDDEVEDLLLQHAVEESKEAATAEATRECWDCGYVHSGYACEEAKALRDVEVSKRQAPIQDLLDGSPIEQAPTQKPLLDLWAAAFDKLDERDNAEKEGSKFTSDGLMQYTPDHWANKAPKTEEEIPVDTLTPESSEGEFTTRSNFDDLDGLYWGSTTNESAAPTDEPWTPDHSSVSGDGENSPRRFSYDAEHDFEPFVLGPQPTGFSMEKAPRGPRRQFGYKANMRAPARKSGFQTKACLATLPSELLTIIVEWFSEDVLRHGGFPGGTMTAEEEAKTQVLLGTKLLPVMRVNRRIRDIVQKHFYRNIRISSLDRFRKFLRTIDGRGCYLGDLVEDIQIDVPQVRKQERIKGYSDREPKPQTEREKRIRREMIDPRTLTMIPRLFMRCPNLRKALFSFIGSIESFDELAERDRPHDSLQSLTLKDIDDNGYSCFSLWKNVQRFPNLLELSVRHSEHSRGEQRTKIPSSIQPYRDGWYRTLKSLYMHCAPEISNEWLVIFAARMPKLESIHIVDCRLVSTNGVARLVSNMMSPLKEFSWVTYLDTQARPDPVERESSSYHLCTALRKHSNSLVSLRMKPVKICSCLFEESNWPELVELNVDLLEYNACDGREKESRVQESLESAVAPCLGPVENYVRLHNPHLTFNRSNSLN